MENKKYHKNEREILDSGYEETDPDALRELACEYEFYIGY